MFTVHPIPVGSSKNQYFPQFYEALENTGEVELAPASLWTLAFTRQRKDATHIIQLYWSHRLYGSKYLVKILFHMVTNIPLVALLKLRGFGFCWTVHNWISHDFPYPELDRIGRYFIERMADRVIVNNKCAKPYMRWPDKVRFVPHGSYIGVYGPRLMDDAEAVHTLRNQYGIHNDRTVYLSLGMIRGYKQIPAIVNAFRAGASDTDVLLIVGHGKPEEVAKIRRAAGDDPRIIIDEQFVPDEQIPTYCALADFGVFNYDESTLVSGGIMLMFSYGVPVIAPDMCASELVTEGKNGYLFNDTRDLQRVFQEANRQQLASADDIVAGVSDYTWQRVAGDTLSVYKECV